MRGYSGDYLDIFAFQGNIRTRREGFFCKNLAMFTTLLVILKPILIISLPILSIFLILLVLVQRGRGGGLVGAFGGMGGQSAFGAKAGDLFTRITVVTVSIWILFCILLLLAMKQEAGSPGGEEWGVAGMSQVIALPD